MAKHTFLYHKTLFQPFLVFETWYYTIKSILLHLNHMLFTVNYLFFPKEKIWLYVPLVHLH